MNCRDIELLLLAERDGVLTAEQHASLEGHVAACPACRQFRTRLAEALNAFQADAANVTVPNAAGEWQAVRSQLGGTGARPARKPPLAPLVWFSASLAAAASLALAYFALPPKSTGTNAPAAEIASANFVEAGDANASTMVYVDKDSGWLVVWASDADANGKG